MYKIYTSHFYNKNIMTITQVYELRIVIKLTSFNKNKNNWTEQRDTLLSLQNGRTTNVDGVYKHGRVLLRNVTKSEFKGIH